MNMGFDNFGFTCIRAAHNYKSLYKITSNFELTPNHVT